jgi:DNA modification methylase
MKVELKHISDLQPYEHNPRVNDPAVEAVARSIREFGWRVPVVIDQNNTVIAGHTRLKAARSIGIEQIPVHVASDLTEAQARAFRLADNATGAIAAWDRALLPLELRGLQDMDFDLSLLGFNEQELARLLSTEPQAGLTDPDEVPASAEAVTRAGDIWILGEHRLLCGDATKRDDVERLLDGDQVTMCFTDPPWNVAIGEDSNPRHRQRTGLKNDNLSPEEFEAFLSSFIAAMQPSLEGDLYCVLGASEWPTLDHALRSHGYHWSATIVWVKDLFVLGRSKYHRRYEPIWYGWHEKGKSSFAGARDQDDVWCVDRPRRSEEHPTMKPVGLVAKAISNSSVAGDVVFDPFGGSGTTLIAAHQLDRRARLIEIDPGFCDVIVRRWENFTGLKAARVAASNIDKREKAPATAEAKNGGKN